MRLTLPILEAYVGLNEANEVVRNRHEGRARSANHGPNLPYGTLVFFGETWILAVQAFGYLLRGKLHLRNTLLQMASIGVDSLPIVLACCLSTGAVYAFYTTDIFVRFGAGNFVGGTLTLSFLLELGPVLAGVNVASRSGAAIAAETGSMVVTEQWRVCEATAGA